MKAFLKTHWVSLAIITVLLGLLWGAINAANNLANGFEQTANNVANAPANAISAFWSGAYNLIAGLFGGGATSVPGSADDSSY